MTVTFVRKKRAHVLVPGRALCGDVIVSDIGAPEQAVAERGVQLRENDPCLWSLPWPSVSAHKHTRGHVMVMSGPSGQTGAGRLAARAALRVGAGLVTVLSPADAMLENAIHLSAIMLRRSPPPDAMATLDAEGGAFVVGPAGGVGPDLLASTVALAALGRPLVIDADALTSAQAAPDDLFAVLHDKAVLTPHPGEFRRLFPDLWAQGASRIEMAQEASRRSRANVLLKGPDTVIAAPDGRTVVNTSGTPFLATAGSGDVLAGLIAGLAAQGMDSFEAACAGAWLHGRLGERLGPGLIAEDLPEALPALLNALAPEAFRRRDD